MGKQKGEVDNREGKNLKAEGRQSHAACSLGNLASLLPHSSKGQLQAYLSPAGKCIGTPQGNRGSGLVK